MMKLFRNLSEKAKKELWSLSPNNLERLIFCLLLLFLPTQLGLHFWPDFSYVSGVRIDYLSPTLYLTDIFIFLLFLLAVFNRNLKLKINIYFAFFCSLVFIGALLSKNLGASIYGIVKLSEFIFLGFYVYKNVKIDNLFLKTFSIGILFESALAILQVFNKGSLGGAFYFLGERAFNSQTPNIANASLSGALILRPYATFSHPNVLAAYLLIGITFIILFNLAKSTKEKLFYLFIVSLGSTALILTLSRTAILAYLFFLLIWLLSLLKSKAFKKAGFVLLLVPLLLFIALPFLPRFINLNLSDQSVTQRKELINASLLIIKHSPIFGVGVNNFLGRLPQFDLSNRNIFYLQPVHNIFLLAVSQIGIIAGSIFVIFVLLLLRKTNYQMKIILTMAIFLGMFDHYFLTLQQAQILFALILGLSFAYAKGKLI